MDAAGVGAMLVGIAAVVGSVASFYVSIRNTKRIIDIDHAVNGKPRGAQTLQSQVSDLHAERPPDDVALKQMMQLLVADMYERRRTASGE